ncbi:2C-methyl-D-erythritol 2,4-cyclodiphosphate synthase [Erysipelotrichaceae bacterium]|nr:2C-methyl-D-erythritol 2,4-cyclodiphosphate synthase [Erysipelotrichaceae bacterium]
MIRIGQSTDIHQLVIGRKCMLGGIEIPHEKGLLGHSDADVLLHVVGEAILGALGLGDLGDHFADTNSAYKDLNSATIVQYAVNLMKKKGYHIGNIDTIILCQAPKISPYKREIKDNIALLLEVSAEDVNIKATTGENLGFIGRGEGIMAQAAVLLVKNSI